MYTYIYTYTCVCVCVYIYIYTHTQIYTVDTEGIQTPLKCSLFHCSNLLKSKKLIIFLIIVHSAPHLDRKNQKCRHFCKFIKKEKLKYHMVISIQTLCSVLRGSPLLS